MRPTFAPKGSSLLVISTVIAALATGCASDDDSCLGELPNGHPRCTNQAACDALEREPERIAHWYIDFVEDADEATVDCLVAYLESRGVEILDDEHGLVFDSGYADARPLLASDSVRNVDASCTEEGCEACRELSPEECADDVLCAVIAGAPLRDGQACITEEPAGCKGVATGCGGAITYARDPEGDCWWFRSNCIPVGWEEDHEGCTSADGTPPVCE